jgi:hypothetical protein
MKTLAPLDYWMSGLLAGRTDSQAHQSINPPIHQSLF